jgi:hypothetical protein
MWYGRATPGANLAAVAAVGRVWASVARVGCLDGFDLGLERGFLVEELAQDGVLRSLLIAAIPTEMREPTML